MRFDSDRFCIKLVQSMADAVVYSDDTGRIQFWNPGAERMFGYQQKKR
jgi:PAS domain S-box-containing protein